LALVRNPLTTFLQCIDNQRFFLTRPGICSHTYRTGPLGRTESVWIESDIWPSEHSSKLASPAILVSPGVASGHEYSHHCVSLSMSYTAERPTKRCESAEERESCMCLGKELSDYFVTTISRGLSILSSGLVHSIHLSLLNETTTICADPTTFKRMADVAPQKFSKGTHAVSSVLLEDP
jgi:hypothetical protein